MMGALFFEMTTKISFYKFIILKDVIFHLSENNASPLEMNEFWENSCKAISMDKINVLIQKSCKEIPYTPQDINILNTSKMQEALRKQMLAAGAPQFYANLIISMIQPEVNKRIDLYDALEELRNHDNSSTQLSELPNGIFEQAQESKQSTI